jgi:menaquinone-specific isochorismate synthase
VTGRAPRLRACTVALEAAPDLLAAAGDDGMLWRGEHGGIAARGEAARITLPGGLADAGSVRRVAEVLDGIGSDDDVGLPGCGPVALGALPFDPAAAGTLVVPRLLVGRDGDRGWVTTVRAEGGETGPRLPGGAPRASAANEGPPDEFRLTSSMSHRDWKDTVAEAVSVLRRGDLDKVVLARRIDITANRDFVVSDVLERLAALYPSCMVFSMGGFLGASPELLISRVGDRVESHPLAGTVARSGDLHGDEALIARLMASPKARHEHQVVVDVLRRALEPLCRDLDVPEQPTVLGLRNVSHLGTHITARLAPQGQGPLPSALELVSRLHPTPAVGGTPTAAAIEYLQKAEGFDRGFYAGPVGWVDARGDGAWAVGIRCAEVEGPTARLYAGNGIVAGSDPSEELAETQLKLQALLAALVRP